MAKHGALPDPKIQPPKPEQKPKKRKEREPELEAEQMPKKVKEEEIEAEQWLDPEGWPRAKSLVRAWAPGRARGSELGLAQSEMSEAMSVLDRASYERLNTPEVDFYRSARCLVDAANTIGQAANTSAQVAEAAARAWRAEAHRMDLIVRELMHQVNNHAPATYQ